MLSTSGDAPLLATKLFVPPPRDGVVPRSRLRDRLAAMRGGRVTLVAAAAGWGKSTLLADWAIEAPGKVAWLSLDPGDDEPRRFLSYLVASLRGAGAVAPEDVAETVPSGEEAVRGTATQILNALTLRGAPVSLILDDYHSIQSRTVHEVVQFIIDHLPPNLHLVLATRVDPPLALSRLRARGLLLELRGHDLRFNAEEAGAFLNGAMGLALGQPAVEELERRTEGWVVGLQMAAISLTGRGAAQEFIERFGGSNRYVLDYLTDEVLDRQPEELRRFLLATSILTRLNASLCDAVMGRSDSEAILARLEAANLFLIPLDDVRYWYRYHHLFATLLQHHLARACSADEINELHRRASQWYVANRMPESALDHALSAGDADRAIGIVATNALSRTLVGDMASVVRWFDRLPQDRIDRDINLLLARGMTLLGDWQLPRAHDCAVKAAALLDEHSTPGQHGAVLGLRGTLERTVGKLDEGNANLQRALPLVEDGTFWAALTRYQAGMQPMYHADAGALVDSVAKTVVVPKKADEVLVSCLATTYLALGEWWRGFPDRAIAYARQMFPWIDMTESIAEERPFDCLPNTILAEVHRSWNDLEAARRFGEIARDRGHRGFMLGLFESSRACAHVAVAAKDWELAVRAATDVQRAVRNVGEHFYMTFGAAVLMNEILFRRWQWEGNRADLQAVEKWMAAETIVEKLTTWRARRFGGYYCDSPLLLATRVLIEREEYDHATEILEEMLPCTRDTQRLLAQMETLILLSIVDARRGRTDTAVASMVRALDLASPARYIRQFADEGPSILPILERAAAVIPDRDFATQVLAAFNATPEKPRTPNTIENLSERELEVLRLIASGATNQEAGRKLFIAPSTVKKHLENIYAKLAVGGRVEAIARAREMSLL